MSSSGTTGATGDGQKDDGGAPSVEQIVAGFNELRSQQRAIIGKMSEIDMDRKEHELVIEALKEVDPSRRCYRMVGGVLVERTVSTVLPALTNNLEQLGRVAEALSSQLEAKGKDLQTYRERHSKVLRVGGDSEDMGGGSTGGGGASNKSSGVLVGHS